MSKERGSKSRSMNNFFVFRQIITCGKNDGDVRIWNDIGDDDPVNFCAGETVLSCAQFTSAENNPILITSNDRNVVQCFSYPSGDRDRVMFRFGAPVTTIKVNDKVRVLSFSSEFFKNLFITVDRSWF